MAAREISIFRGDFSQTAADVYTELVLPIETNARRAIQIYKANFDLSATNVKQSAVPSDITIGMYEANDPALDESSLLSRGISNKAAGPIDVSLDWTAPPSLLLGKKKLVLFIDSVGTGVAQLMRYQIYYKVVSVSDMQSIQLRKM